MSTMFFELEQNLTLLFSDRTTPKALWVNKCAIKAKKASGSYKKYAAAIYSAIGINSKNHYATLSKWVEKKRKKFGRQLVNSEFLLRNKNIEGFHYSKVRALKQHLKCYPAVQDHENL